MMFDVINFIEFIIQRRGLVNKYQDVFNELLLCCFERIKIEVLKVRRGFFEEVVSIMIFDW